MEQAYRLVGVDGVARWVRDRAAIRVVDGRVLLTGAVRDISAQRHAEDERADAVRRLEWLSSVDALTELFNRRHFSEVLRARLAGSAAGAAIALVDVDHFKRINDTQGHQIGDVVLREIARRLKDATRPCDVTSRWGGEEFCVLLDEIGDDDELETLVERLRASVAASPIPVGGNGAVEVTISIGAVRPSAECHTPEQLLASADAALYAAKRGGRNQARIADGAPLLVPVDASEGLEGVVQALAAAASVRGGIGPMHAAQVAALSTAVALELELPAATVELARLGGWLHDCGKVTVPTDILAHRGPLDDQARDRMRHHAIAGEALVSVVPGLSSAAQIVRSHHERFDGTGLSRRPGRGADPSRGPHRGGGRRLRGDDREPPLRGPARAPRRDRRAAEQRGRPVRSARRGCARRRARPRAPGRPGARQLEKAAVSCPGCPTRRSEMRRMNEAEIRAFLTFGTRTGKLGVTRLDGSPMVVPIWFGVDDDGTLLFTTWGESIKGKSLRRDGRVSLCVDEDSPPYAYVRVDGTTTLLDDPELLRSWAARIGGALHGS